MFCGSAEHGLEEIRRACHASKASIEHMRVDQRGLHVTVAFFVVAVSYLKTWERVAKRSQGL